jgi:hypothetical protein
VDFTTEDPEEPSAARGRNQIVSIPAILNFLDSWIPGFLIQKKFKNE